MECSICFECMNPVTNFVITECGHNFHTNCLMENISHNGFACPCCRSLMTKDKEEESNDVDEDNEDDIDEYAFNGLRFVMLFIL